MQSDYLITADQQTKLHKTLTALNEIGTQINNLSEAHDLLAILEEIVEQAVRAMHIFAEADEPSPPVSAVIWVYDEESQTFERNLRVSAGEPRGKVGDDAPRATGFGRLAIRRRRRVISYEEGNRALHASKRREGAKVLVCYPLIVSDEVVGVLYLYRYRVCHFSETELLTLDNFVNLAAMAIHHGRQVMGMAHELDRTATELKRLHRAAQVINTRTSLKELMRAILNLALDMTAAQYGSFELYDKRNRCLNTTALVGRSDLGPEFSTLPVDNNSLVGMVAKNKRTLRINDLYKSRWGRIYQPIPADKPMRSELIVPLVSKDGGLEGVLNIESPIANTFSEADQHLVELFAEQAVIALQEMRLFEAVQEISEAALTATEDDLLSLIIHRAQDLINVAAVSIWTIDDPKQQQLTLRQSTLNRYIGETLPLAGSITEEAIQIRKLIAVEDVQKRSKNQSRQFAVTQGWRSAIVVPLLTPDSKQAIGSFGLYATELRDFSDWDRKLITYLAKHAAIAIHNAKEVAELKQFNLSEREREVLALLIEGNTNKEIAGQLIVSVNTIKKHVQSIFTKLNVDSRAAAVAKALGQAG